ncbi:uncharacterized protein RSE6_10028 [Rhynchosporium secalis]|uniref:Uncharacterized protein n=1 Tax=Rhynchosporium secalis TaxID=38038 RepID=A0A1E1MJC9_RHYSE|nr:uncharacterized protein RSE6_10028 [Rhynchosporium secalis]
MKASTVIAILSASAPGVLAVTRYDDNFVPKLDPSLLNTPAYARFQDKTVVTLVADHYDNEKRDEEPDPNRPVTLQDGLVFVLQCTQAGFRKPSCVSFGAKPGACVSYFDFQSGNDTSVSDTFNNRVLSISTNTGGACQFYKYLSCDNKGDDRGLTVDYNYDISVAPADDPRVPEYVGNITSYRFLDCDVKGDDRGVTISYNYNLVESSVAGQDDYSGDYASNITSYRC